MPAIRLFNRRTLLGGDDLQFPAIVCISVRCFQLFCLTGICWAYILKESRHAGGFLQWVLFGPPVTKRTIATTTTSTRSVEEASGTYDNNGNGAVSYDDDATDDGSPYYYHNAGGSDSTRQSNGYGGDGSGNFGCRHSHLFPMLIVSYSLICGIFFIIGIYIERRIYHWSCIGCPIQMQPRSRHIQALLELRLLPLSIALALLSCMGTVTLCFVKFYYACRQQSSSSPLQEDDEENTFWGTQVPNSHFLWMVAIFLLIVSQAFDAFVSLAYIANLYFFRPNELVLREQRRRLQQQQSQQPQLQRLNSSTSASDFDTAASNSTYHLQSGITAYNHHHHHHNHHHHHTANLQHHNHELLEEMWSNRCSYLCRCLGFSTCFFFGGREISMLVGADVDSKFGDIARALADYLETRGVLDVVPSDIMTGLLVSQHIQRKRIQHYGRKVYTEYQRLMLQSGGPPKKSSSYNNYASSSSSSPSPSEQQRQSIINNNFSIATGTTKGDPLFVSSNHSRGYQQALQPPNLAKQDSSSQLLDEETMGNGGVQPAPKVLDPSNINDLRILQEGAHFSRYALAIYTWILYLYEYPISGIPHILSNCAACRSKRRNSDYDIDHNLHSTPDHCRIIGDNMCQIHKTTLLLQAGLRDTDLIYAQLKNSFDENPYCILLDHSWKCVVVAIRGTFSLEDCVTDVLMDPESLESLGEEFDFDGKNQHCHGGVLTCVRNVYSDLQRHQILDQLLCNEDSLYRNYTLRFVGHSLGGATCTVLSYMLRKKFPTMRCINYAPPGCTLTWGMAVRCQEWCTSFAIDSDVVPRLSKENLWKLRDEVLELIGRIKVPKIEVAQKLITADNNNNNNNDDKKGNAFMRHCCPKNLQTASEYMNAMMTDSNIIEEISTTTTNEQHSIIDDILHNSSYDGNTNTFLNDVTMTLPPAAAATASATNTEDEEEVVITEYHKQLNQFKRIQEERKQARGTKRSIQLYPPGIFVHIVKTNERSSILHNVAKCLTCWTTNAGFQYTPVYVRNDGFNEIIVTPTMHTDHFPNRIRFELENVAKDYGLDVENNETEESFSSSFTNTTESNTTTSTTTFNNHTNNNNRCATTDVSTGNNATYRNGPRQNYGGSNNNGSISNNTSSASPRKQHNSINDNYDVKHAISSTSTPTKANASPSPSSLPPSLKLL